MYISISPNLLVHRLLAHLAKLAQWLVQKALLEVNAPQKRLVRVLELCLVGILSGSIKTKRSHEIILNHHCWWPLMYLTSTKKGSMTQYCPDHHHSKILTSNISGCIHKRCMIRCITVWRTLHWALPRTCLYHSQPSALQPPPQALNLVSPIQKKSHPHKLLSMTLEKPEKAKVKNLKWKARLSFQKDIK